MNTKIRIAVALVFCAAILVLGAGAPAWADNLNLARPSGGPSGQPAVLPMAESRPPGTVGTSPNLIPITGTGPVTVGSCATVWVKSPPADVSYTASVVPESELPTPFPAQEPPPPAVVVTCAIKIEAVTSTDLGSDTLVCWPLLNTTAGFAYYWDGSAWQKAASQTSDNEVCANVVPGSGPNPAFAVVFSK
jgi:hypothetical protein